MKSRRHVIFLGLITVSFVVLMVAWMLRAGIGATSYETLDSAGRTLGFNDPISAEHYRIIFGNVTPSVMLRNGAEFGIPCAILHGVAAWLLLSPQRRHRRSTRWFFAVNAVLFWFGWPSWFAILTGYVGRISSFRMDREDVIDIPFVWMWGSAFWVLAATAITLFNQGEPLFRRRTGGWEAAVTKG